MKTSIIRINIIVFCFLILCGVSTTGHARLLWKITGNHIKKTSYLLGTSHFVSVTFCDTLTGFEKAFRSSRQFYGEFSMTDSANMKALGKIPALELLPNNQSLSDFYTPEEYEQILQYVESILGYRPGKITFTPDGLFLFLTTHLYLTYLPQRLAISFIDVGLQQRAKEAGKTIGGLESAQSQVELLWSEDMEKQTTQLLELVRNPAYSKDSIVNIQKILDVAYYNQDLNTLSSILKQDMDDEEYKDFVLNRNLLWLPVMEEAMKKCSTFFAVGAGHLVGENGIIERLRKQGYTVVPITE